MRARGYTSRLATEKVEDMAFLKLVDVYGPEPMMVGVKDIDLIRMMNWYNLNAGTEERRKWILEYAEKRLGYDETDLSLLSSVALQLVQTVPYCARAILKGSTFAEQKRVVDLIDNTCRKAIENARVVYNQNQAQREQSKLRSMMTRKTMLANAYWSIFEQLEGGTTNVKLDALASLTPAEMDQIKSRLEFNLEDFKAAKNDPEGYEGINLRASIKRLEGVLQSISQQSSTAKARKNTTVIRKRKPVTAAKQVSKLRYAKEIDGFKSIDPEAILTSSILFVYDSKTRRLIKFSNPDGVRMVVLGSKVKAHTIVSRTLRKPSITLTEMRKGTIKTAERVYDELTTKDAPHSGRMTDKCLILRVNSV